MHFSVLLTLGMMLLVTDAQEECFCKMPNFLTGQETRVQLGQVAISPSERAFGIDFSRPSLNYVVFIGDKNLTTWTDNPRDIVVVNDSLGLCNEGPFNRDWLSLVPEQCVPHKQLPRELDDGPGITTFFDDTRNPSINHEITYKVDDNCIPTSIVVRSSPIPDIWFESTFYNFKVHSNLTLAYFLEGIGKCWDDCDNPYLQD